MSALALGRRRASIVWLEQHRLRAGMHALALQAAPSEAQISNALSTLPPGPTYWVVDDAWAPSILLWDVGDLPPGADAQEQFFKWRFEKHLALDQAQAVQAIHLENGAWLLSGLPVEMRDTWVNLAMKANRPIQTLVPRWLWLFNHLAARLEYPGMLLSLGVQEDGHYNGTLIAWGRQLSLVRFWDEPATPEEWNAQRLTPSAAFLAREGRSPQGLHIWGAPDWPDLGLPIQLLQAEIPQQEES